jgi:hypothetical protein
MDTLPLWVRRFSDTCIRALGLEGWRIELCMAERIAHPSGEAWGVTVWDEGQLGRYEARITLDASLEEGELGYYVVAHELVHLALAEVYYASLPLHDEAAWWEANEAVVERIARALLPSVVLIMQQEVQHGCAGEVGHGALRALPIEAHTLRGAPAGPSTLL